MLPAGRWSAAGRSAALVLALLLLAVPLFAAAETGPLIDRLLGSAGPAGSALSRPAMWRDALALIGETPFTGSGLGSTAMVYSSYALLIHAPYVWQLHNLFLQMAVEQGLPGLIAFLALLGAALWGLLAGGGSHGRSHGALWLASLVSLAALAVHGTVDAGLYASKAVPLLFVPIGMAFAQAQPWAWGERSGRAGAALALALAALVVLLLIPAVRAAFQADLGAVSQARAELAAYPSPAAPIQDALRRSPSVDLAPAIARYRAALALDPESVAANRRLGQIELSRGQYEAARGHLAAAYAGAPGQRAARLLLGESYAAAGDVAQAARLWSGLEGTGVALAERAWWYGSLGDTQRQEWVAEAARLAASGAAGSPG